MLLKRFIVASALTALPLASASGSTAKTAPVEATAVFAMGCFWCAEADFEKVPGVTKVVSGYTGGRVAKPTYEQVSAGGTGHYEAVLVTYNPAKVRYSDLLTVFWRNVDPFDADGQFCDKGESYRAAIFPGNEVERKAAQASRDYLVGNFKRDLATKIVTRATFYPAEGYHQDYYKKNPIRYRFYRSRCGRDDRLVQVWGKK
ncbi:MAG: peptide-methionine (S)-S-oxide reductase MsrA [Sphingorhabdus sp.]